MAVPLNPKGGGGNQQMFSTGKLRPKVQSLTPLHTICHERYPFCIPSTDKWYPFHIPCLELRIPYNC